MLIHDPTSSNRDNKYTASDICKMNEFLVDNIYVRFDGQLFRHGILLGTNCAPLLADLFLCSCENEFLDKLVKVAHYCKVRHIGQISREAPIHLPENRYN